MCGSNDETVMGLIRGQSVSVSCARLAGHATGKSVVEIAVCPPSAWLRSQLALAD